MTADTLVIKASSSYCALVGFSNINNTLGKWVQRTDGDFFFLRLEMSCGPNLWDWHINSALKFTHWCFIDGFCACSSLLRSCSLPLWNLKKFNRIWCSRFIMHYLIVTLNCAVITHLTGVQMYYVLAQRGYGIVLEYELLWFVMY